MAAEDFRRADAVVDDVEVAGSAAEKKSLYAAEQDTAAGQARRFQWWKQAGRIDPERLIFLDESGITTEMTRRYGRGPGGERVREATPGGHWRTLTVLGAIRASGWVGVMTIEAATDGDVFLAYLDQVLCPQLRPGDVVVMDNLSAHKVDGVRARLQAEGAHLLYLPPYSPDFNPIEKCWAPSQTIPANLEGPLLGFARTSSHRGSGPRDSQSHAGLFQALRLWSIVIGKLLLNSWKMFAARSGSAH